MKILSLLFILFVCIFGVQCSNNEDLSNSPDLTALKPTAENFQPRPDTPFLEVITTHQSEVDWIRGEFIELRLYDDGTAVFDDYFDESGSIDADAVQRLRKQTKLNDTEFSSIKELLATKEFRDLRKTYSKTASSCDAVPIVNIKTKNKYIKIAWCDSLSHPRISPEFPQILSIFFRQIQEIKGKRLGKEIYFP